MRNDDRIWRCRIFLRHLDVKWPFDNMREEVEQGRRLAQLDVEDMASVLSWGEAFPMMLQGRAYASMIPSLSAKPAHVTMAVCWRPSQPCCWR